MRRRLQVARVAVNIKALTATTIPLILTLAGVASAGVAIFHERRMHRHRQPGVTYADATLRRDGGRRRADLFTPIGLTHQRHASRYGVLAAALWILALVVYIMSGIIQGRT